MIDKILIVLYVVFVWVTRSEVIPVTSANIEQIFASNELVILNFCTSCMYLTPKNLITLYLNIILYLLLKYIYNNKINFFI